MNKKYNNQKLIQLTIIAVLVIGLVLRAYQYLMGRSLWDDESHLALNFMDRGFVGITKPLAYIQAAPALFLLLVKAVVEIFGYNEFAFRAVPFLSSILTLPLIYFITRELTGNKITGLIAFFIFSTNLCLIYFSSELKQYAVEVSVYLLLIYLTVGKNRFLVQNRTLLLAFAGSISIFLSNTAFLILFCIACKYFLDWYEQKKIIKANLKIFIPWLLSFLLNYFLFIYHHPSAAQQKINYSYAFVPTNILSHEFVDFLKRAIDEIFFNQVFFISKSREFSYPLLFVFFIAIRHIIIRKQHNIFLLVCLPILLHLGLSALKIYPFTYRLTLYLVPCFIILMSVGVIQIALFLRRRLHISIAVAAVIYCLYFFSKGSLKQFPLWYREIKPSLNYINDSLPPTAHVYITDPVNLYTYYVKRSYVKNRVYKTVPWEIELPEYYDIVYEETSNYLLFYSTLYQWGYGKVLEDLKNKGLIVRTFEYKGYAVSEIRPAEHDTGLIKHIDYSFFDPAVIFQEDKSIAIWSDSVVSRSFNLRAGKYQISILSRGTPVNKIFPRNQLFINDQLVGEFSSYQQYKIAEFNFQTSKDVTAVFKITMINDTVSKTEDVNTFIKSINIRTASN